MDYPTRYVVCKKAHVRVFSDDGSDNVNIDITTCRKYFKKNLGVVILIQIG